MRQVLCTVTFFSFLAATVAAQTNGTAAGMNGTTAEGAAAKGTATNSPQTDRTAMESAAAKGTQMNNTAARTNGAAAEPAAAKGTATNSPQTDRTATEPAVAKGTQTNGTAAGTNGTPAEPAAAKETATTAAQVNGTATQTNGRTAPEPADAKGKATAGQTNGTAAASPTTGGIQFSGAIDGYYSLNFNHPASRTNQLRNFDTQANQFSLNMAKLTIERAPEPLGFRVDVGIGRAFETMHGAETGPGIFRNLEQAFVSLKPAAARGLQVDFGKFVTSAGAEVIETQSNWNYSRSLLFALAIPYYHFGLRAGMPLGSHFTAGLQLVNGWNNVEDNNSGKTVGLTGAISAGKINWTHNYYFGSERTDTNKAMRRVYDTTVLVTASTSTSFYVNFDYGADKDGLGGARRWTGVAAAARHAVTPWLAFAPRLEWFNDADGFATGTAQKLKEATLTAEFKIAESFLTRLEYRQDWSNTRYFERGGTPGASRSQQTVLVGFIAVFGPKR